MDNSDTHMRLTDIQGMLTTGLSLLKLKIKGHIAWHFIIVLSSIKFLRAISKIVKISYIKVNYNDKLKYTFPIKQVCDWYHVTTEVLAERNCFKPKYGQVIVDVGANVGLYAMYCAQKVGSKGLVVAIEPDSYNFIYLYINKNTNGFNNVVLLNIALASYVGKTKLFTATPTSHSIIKNFALAHGGKGCYSEVPCRTLDSLVLELGLSHIDLLNLDVEGGAFTILRGCQSALKKKIIHRMKIEIEDEKEVAIISEYLHRFQYEVHRSGIFFLASVKS